MCLNQSILILYTGLGNFLNEFKLSLQTKMSCSLHMVVIKTFQNNDFPNILYIPFFKFPIDFQIPDRLSVAMLESAGVQMENSDPRLARLISLAGQKFLTDILSDAMLHWRLANGQPTGLCDHTLNASFTNFHHLSFTFCMIPPIHNSFLFTSLFSST
ncbi:unnamed protein product [Schistosoma margrebowiei]|uniref:Uncharacterized protein n=1 Tax=Schistosoma margrebowiei TaxID=48269 RepID=A0A183LI03_9TREM|nr:unnamed protein product [Schistosoma margrebowiei]